MSIVYDALKAERARTAHMRNVIIKLLESQAGIVFGRKHGFFPTEEPLRLDLYILGDCAGDAFLVPDGWRVSVGDGEGDRTRYFTFHGGFGLWEAMQWAEEMWFSEGVRNEAMKALEELR